MWFMNKLRTSDKFAWGVTYTGIGLMVLIALL